MKSDDVPCTCQLHERVTDDIAQMLKEAGYPQDGQVIRLPTASDIVAEIERRTGQRVSFSPPDRAGLIEATIPDPNGMRFSFISGGWHVDRATAAAWLYTEACAARDTGVV